jgi:hypothetical protein
MAVYSGQTTPSAFGFYLYIKPLMLYIERADFIGRFAMRFVGVWID